MPNNAYINFLARRPTDPRLLATPQQMAGFPIGQGQFGPPPFSAGAAPVMQAGGLGNQISGGIPPGIGSIPQIPASMDNKRKPRASLGQIYDTSKQIFSGERPPGATPMFGGAIGDPRLEGLLSLSPALRKAGGLYNTGNRIINDIGAGFGGAGGLQRGAIGAVTSGALESALGGGLGQATGAIGGGGLQSGAINEASSGALQSVLGGGGLGGLGGGGLQRGAIGAAVSGAAGGLGGALGGVAGGALGGVAGGVDDIFNKSVMPGNKPPVVPGTRPDTKGLSGLFRPAPALDEIGTPEGSGKSVIGGVVRALINVYTGGFV